MDTAAHGRDRAAQHLVERVLTARSYETVAATLARLQQEAFDSIDNVYIVDGSNRLRRVVPLQAILKSDPGKILSQLPCEAFPRAHPDDDQERVASLAIQFGVTSVPVTDSERVLLGVVPTGALCRILRAEHEEDLNRLTGILHNNSQALDAVEGAPVHRVLGRLPWLLFGLVGSMLMTWFMTGFEEKLIASVAVAFFIPGVTYLGDAIGTQSEAIAVRGLSLSGSSMPRLVLGELYTGFWISLILGCFIVPSVWFAFGDVRLAFGIAMVVLVAGACSSLVGLLFPWLLDRLGTDPAFGSGPVVTILQDFLTLIVYFAMVVLWL